MEYAIPNNVENQTSQEVGLAALNAFNVTGNPFPQYHCVGSPATATWDTAQNPLNEVDNGTGTNLSRNSGVISARYRAIGTGNEVKAVQATSDSLGYSFWSAANFAGATAGNSKYLTVDGIDPIQQDWVDGLVPTSGNGLLGNVTMAHVKDGSYPIWSILRLVSDPSNASKAATLAADAAKFLSPTQPDFVQLGQLKVVRSHFAPPGVNFPSPAGTNAPSNGSGATAEAGGDVAGLVYSIQADGSYNSDNGITTGNTGHRQ